MNRRGIFKTLLGAIAAAFAWIKPRPHRIVSTRHDWNEEARRHIMHARTDRGGWLPLTQAKYHLVQSLLGVGVKPLAHKIERFANSDAIELTSDANCMDRAKEMFS